MIRSIAIAAVVGLLLGLVAGLYIGHVWHAASLKKIADKTIVQANKDADKRVVDEHAAVAKTEADLAEQQALTGKLNADLSAARSSNLVLQGKLDELTFHPPTRPLPQRVAGQPEPRCPGHPVSSPEFLRYYNDAAKGTAASADGPVASAGGVYESTLRVVR